MTMKLFMECLSTGYIRYLLAVFALVVFCDELKSLGFGGVATFAVTVFSSLVVARLMDHIFFDEGK